MSLIYLSCAWVAGIILGSELDLPLFFVFSGLIPLSLLFFTRRHRKKIILAGLCLVAFFSGAWHFQSSLPADDESCLRFYNDSGPVEVRGIVDSDPEAGAKTTRLHFSAREIKLDGEWREVSGAALLYVPPYTDYSYGDNLSVRGELKTPPRFDDFDYEKYLASREIYSVMSYPEVEISEPEEGLKPLGWVYSLRDRLSQTLAEVLPEPQASLAQGIILGTRGNIPPAVKTDFAHTGTAHLLAVSGLHLSIIAGMMLSFGIWLFGRKRYIYVWLALGAIWLYALLTGMHPPVLRAAIMASLFLAAELLGRQRSAATALAFAAAVMVGISPQILRDASFQMSFAAMAGLVFIFPLVQSLFRRAVRAALGESGMAVSAANFTVDSLSVSLGAIIAVWPLVAYYFGIISPAAPLATFFALPALPGVIFSGALAGVLGMIALPLGQVIAWLAWLFLSYMLLVVGVFSAVIPFIEGGFFDARLIWIYYGALAVIIWLVARTVRESELGPGDSGRVTKLPAKPVLLSLLAAVLVSVVVVTMPDDNLRVSFLDVGQGDAILIQRGSRQILVDGGPGPQAINLALSKKMPFWDRTIDMVVLTHPSADHVTGLVEVLRRYRVRQVLYPEMDFSSGVYDEWLRLLEEKDIDYTHAEAGQRIEFGTAVIEVLNPLSPPLDGTESDVDNNGMVLRLETGEVSFLLTADIMWEAELELIYSRADLDSTVLKVAHHGSTTSTTEEFLAVVNPQFAVIQVGEDNPFGHPRSEVRDRLEARVGGGNIYRTDEDGTIEFITDGRRLWVRVER